MIFSKLFLGLAIGMIFHSDSIFFRSDGLDGVKLHAYNDAFSIRDDAGVKVKITALEDQQQVIYWHRRVKTEVCQTGECKLVDVGLYWDCTGDFFGIEVYGEHLTKTDHSIFLPHDYDQLMSILFNDWSILREYGFSDLTSESSSNGVDATSGATRKEIASEAVKNAVYTTYTLWHLVHGGEKEQLSQLTVELLKDERYVKTLLSAATLKFDYFLLDMLAQLKLRQSEQLNGLMVRGLRSEDDPFMQDLALKALARADVSTPTLQSEVAEMYRSASPDVKLRILTALKNLKQVHASLASALLKDLDPQNEWFAVKILPLLLNGPAASENTLRTVRKLLESGNQTVREAARQFLTTFDQH